MPNSVTAAAYLAGFSSARYSTIAALTVLLYDYVLTFKAEVKYICRQRWSVGKVIFLFNRYWALIILIFCSIVLIDDYVMFEARLTADLYVCCNAFTWIQSIGVVLSVGGVEIILQARIYAVYGRNKRVLILLGSLSFLEFVTVIVLLRLGLGPRLLGAPEVPWILQGEIKYFHGVSGCVRNSDGRADFFPWIPPIVFESFLCLMMIYQVWVRYMQNWRSPLVNLLVRDSMVYFFTIFLVLLVNCLFYALAVHHAPEVLTSLSCTIALPSVLGSRLLLGMNKRYMKERNEHIISEDISCRAQSVEMTVLSSVCRFQSATSAFAHAPHVESSGANSSNMDVGV